MAARAGAILPGGLHRRDLNCLSTHLTVNRLSPEVEIYRALNAFSTFRTMTKMHPWHTGSGTLTSATSPFECDRWEVLALMVKCKLSAVVGENLEGHWFTRWAELKKKMQRAHQHRHSSAPLPTKVLRRKPWFCKAASLIWTRLLCCCWASMLGTVGP